MRSNRQWKERGPGILSARAGDTANCPQCGAAVPSGGADGQWRAHIDADTSKSDLLAHIRHLETVIHDLEEFGFRIAHDQLDPARKVQS